MFKIQRNIGDSCIKKNHPSATWPGGEHEDLHNKARSISSSFSSTKQRTQSLFERHLTPAPVSAKRIAARQHRDGFGLRSSRRRAPCGPWTNSASTSWLRHARSWCDQQTPRWANSGRHHSAVERMITRRWVCTCVSLTLLIPPPPTLPSSLPSLPMSYMVHSPTTLQPFE